MAYRDAMNQAQEASVRGDFLTAARAYRGACQAAPDDEKACSQFPVYAQKATDKAIEDARPGCDAGDLDRCLPPLLAAKDLIPEHAQVNAMLEKASQVHAERCAQWSPEGPVSAGVAHVACLQSRANQLPVSSYQSLLVDRATRLSARFADLARTAQNKGSAGAASVLWSSAQCLAPGGEASSRAAEAHQAFLTQSAIPIVAELGGSMSSRVADGLSGVCSRLASGLPALARCAEQGTVPGQPAPLQLQVDANIQRPRETVAQDLRSVRYVSGTQQVPNPDFENARQRLNHAEHELHETERHKKDADALCEKAKHSHEATCVGCKETPQQTACRNADELGRTLVNQRRERDSALAALDHTPRAVNVDVWDTFNYPVLQHRWSANFRFALQTNTPGASLPEQQDGQLSFQDEEHVGFSPAGLAPDPLEAPPAQAYADAFLQQLAPRVFDAVRRDAAVRAAARRAQCDGLPADWSTPWVQCWAEVALWGNGQEPQARDFLQVLASSANAPAQPACR